MKLRIINASPGLGRADVYIVAPGTDLTTVSPTISSLAFEVASSYQLLAAGTYEVFFTLPGRNSLTSTAVRCRSAPARCAPS